LELEKTPKTISEKHRLLFSIIQEQLSLTLWSKKRYLESGVGFQPAGITPRVLQSSHVKSQSQEKQHEVASNHLTVSSRRFKAQRPHDVVSAVAYHKNASSKKSILLQSNGVKQ
jgi:hypothetical protein